MAYHQPAIALSRNLRNGNAGIVAHLLVNEMKQRSSGNMYD